MPCLKLCDLIYHPTCFHFTSYHCLTWKAPRTGVRQLSIQHWEVSMAAKDNPGAKEGCRSPNDGRLVGIRYLMVTNLLLTQIWKETPLQEKWVGLLVRLWMSVMPWKLWIKNNKPCLHAFLVSILVRKTLNILKLPSYPLYQALHLSQEPSANGFQDCGD